MKHVFLKLSQNLQENTSAEMSYSQKSSRPEVCSFIKRDPDTGVFLLILENFKSISGRLLVSVKGTINCFYRRESCKYDSTVKRKTFTN